VNSDGQPGKRQAAGIRILVVGDRTLGLAYCHVILAEDQLRSEKALGINSGGQAFAHAGFLRDRPFPEVKKAHLKICRWQKAPLEQLMADVEFRIIINCPVAFTAEAAKNY
jgi:hypothetical protein